MILALEAGGGIKQQDARIKMSRTAKPTAVSFQLLSSLFSFPGPKIEHTLQTEAADLPARSTAGWSLVVQGQLIRTARSLRSLQHSPASLKALLVIAQHLLQQIWCGRAAVEMKPLVSRENRQTIVWEKSYLPPSSHQFHPWVKTPFFQQPEPTPKTP